jgi:glycosyltransferase involved in cell wall biosynthesis
MPDPHLASPLPPPPAHTWLVVPCYNEANRLPREPLIDFVQDFPGVHILLVNDGSRDGTLRVLHEVAAAAGPAISVLDLPTNMGKAEAVRAGFRHAFAHDPEFIGYWDADLATPLSELPEFITLLQTEPQTQMALGARVQLLGRDIHRRLSRHYIGRLFATLASLYLGVRIYDTQCGAKLLRHTPLLREIFADPWEARWLFDVELLVRYLNRMRGRRDLPPGYGIHELPLHAWEDVGGSKVRPIDFPKAWVELVRIMLAYGRPLGSHGRSRPRGCAGGRGPKPQADGPGRS